MTSFDGNPELFPLFQRADGFYHADVNGHLGLVPGSFLDEYANGVRYERLKENYSFFTCSNSSWKLIDVQVFEVKEAVFLVIIVIMEI